MEYIGLGENFCSDAATRHTHVCMPICVHTFLHFT